jgi:2'-hydroxyisoflavone reductase
MRILFLGGTAFVGRHTLEAALERGHQVTFVHRGRTGARLHARAERIVADRSLDLTALAGREFDAVIDTSGYFPADVERSTDVLRGSVGSYLFVSSQSVYADTATPGLDETAALAELSPTEPTDVVTGENYGPLKALCEQVVRAAFPETAVILRPGLIVGRHDPTGRFAYWPVRVAEGGHVLCPAPPNQPVQVIDARDLARFALDLLERGDSGTFDVVCQAGTLTFEGVIDACMQVAGSNATPVWVDERFLLDRDVEPWSELPLWTPGDEFYGFQRSDVSRALAAGLRVRPILETVRDTLEWSREAGQQGGSPLSREREATLLAEWSGNVGG